MYLRSLSIVNFKNIRESTVDFSPRLNCLIGDNGAGKTNVLDSLYYLSFCKSFFNPVDLLNICHGESFFMLNGKYFRREADETVACGFQSGQKKQFKRNGKVYKKLADHIGLLPLVMVSPSDANLILGGSDERRKFMDGVISQYDPGYLENLLRYNRVLLQRNNLLKQNGTDPALLSEMLAVYDMQLVEFGERIHLMRREFIEKLIPVFQYFYSFISQGNETVGLSHQSDLYGNDFGQLLADALPRDRVAQFTTVGIHKDDLQLSLSGYPIKKLGSQGQQKTYLVALKLAQYEFIRQLSGMKPILLLDDIFDKLDRNRVEQIVKVVSGDAFGQIFITDTNREHLDSILHSVTPDYRLFKVINGKIELAS